MTGALVNNTDGAVIMESNASENNNWLWKENSKAWGLFWFNRGSQSGQTIGGYSTVGAELMFMGGNTGVAMPSGWTGYQSGSYIAAMISNYNGYIYSASTIYAATSMVVGGNTVYHTGNIPTWNQSTTGNAATATALSSGQSNWSGTGVLGNVVGLLAWKNYSNNHVIFDASNGTSPSGGGVSQTNATVAWTASYPTLMGWNGTSTYGVRVDSARIADSASSVAWTNVSSRPTNLSSFTNDLGNYGGWITGVTNISGYAGSINIPDWRDTSYTPSQYDGNRVNWHFNNTSQNGGPAGDYWGAMQTVSPWSEFNQSHRQSQLWWGGSVGLSYRYATGSGYTVTGWSSWERIMTSGNSAIAWNMNQYVRTSDSVSFAGGTFGGGSSDQGIYIDYSNYGSGYGRIRFRQDGSNHSTIHSFSAGWQGGSAYASSTGCINIAGQNGVTFGGWNTADAVITPDGMAIKSWATPSGSTGWNGSAVLRLQQGSTGNNVYLQFRNRADAGDYAGFLFTDNNTGGYIAFRTYVGSGANNGYNGDYMVYGTYTDHIFQAGSSETVNGKTEVFRISANGNVTATGDVTAYSDARVKENILTIDNALEKTLALRGVYYNRTDKDDKSQKMGVIAQEVLKVLPEVVSGSEDNVYSVAYGNMAGLFIEAIKELNAKISYLESQLASK